MLIVRNNSDYFRQKNSPSKVQGYKRWIKSKNKYG